MPAGRPRRDRFEVVRTILDAVEADPTAPTVTLARRAHVRDAHVRAVLSCLKALDETRIPKRRPGRRQIVRNSESGTSASSEGSA